MNHKSSTRANIDRHADAISFGLAPMGSQLGCYHTRRHADAISFGLVPMESQLRCYHTRRHTNVISIGLAPMGSQLSGYGACQPSNRGFRRGEPGGELEFLWECPGSVSVVGSIGASPMEAGRQLATITDFSGLQRGRIHRKCPRNS